MALRSSSSLGRVSLGGDKSFARIKDMFFDRARVIAAVDKATQRSLSKFGGLVRTTAQRSMRKRKKGFSAPGQPPFSKKGDLRKMLFYSFDPRTRTVVVGPLGYKSSTTPSLHEFGGTRTVKDEVYYEKNKPGRDARGKFVSAGVRRIVFSGVVTYPARPFMRPALNKMLPRFAEQFRGSIGG